MLSHLGSSDGFLPHAFCYRWQSSLIWLHAVSDILIGLAYISIPVTLFQLVRRRKDIPFGWMFMLFATFITACGATHLMEVWTLWVPNYWLSGGVKAITAIASVPTAVLLVRLLPTALSIPSRAQMVAADAELLRSQAFLAEGQRLSHTGTWAWDASSGELWWSEEHYRLFGLDPENTSPSLEIFWQAVHPEDRPLLAEIIDRAIHEKSDCEHEFRIVRPDRSIRYLRSIGHSVVNESGSLVEFIGTSMDVTERKRTEEVRRHVEEHHGMVVETASDAVVTVDEMGQILFANSATTTIFGYPTSELVGRPVTTLVPESLRETYNAGMHRYLATGERHVNGHGIELTGLRKNEEEFPVEISFGEAEEEGHRTFTGFIRDITERKRAEDALRESEDRYRDLVENSSDLICTHDAQGMLLSVNETPLRILGYSRDELLNKPLRDFVTPEARLLCDAYLAQVQTDGFARGLLPVLTKSGEVRLWEYNNSLRKEGVSSPIVRGIAHDVTEQKRAEEALRRSEEKFSKAFHSSPVEMFVTTLEEGRFIDVNESVERNIGYTRDEMIGRTSLELGLWINPTERAAIVEEIKKNGRIVNREIQIRSKSGEIEIKLYSAELLKIGREQCLLGVCEDITDRKKSEEELQRLSGQLLRLHDEERRNIARDLHDNTGQGLVALATFLGQFRSLIPSSNRKLRKLLSECQALTDQCLREVRTLSYLLHPPLLDETGLEDAIHHYVQGLTKRSGIQVELEVPSNFGRIPRDVELALFRVVQEGLTNIQRHSGGLQARIRINRNPEMVTLEVIDQGREIGGPERKQTEAFPLEAGVGISSMRERVKQIGGSLDIESSSRGTTVRVVVPVDGYRRKEASHSDN
jgi:PAS domain S-box-containing protein